MRISGYPNYQTYNKPSNISFAARNPMPQVGKYFHIENSGYHPNIQAAMKRLAQYDVEHGIIFSKHGELLIETIGNKNYAWIEKDHNNLTSIARRNPSSILLHNHLHFDKDGHPLPITVQDVMVAGMRDISEAIVIHPNCTFSSVKCLPTELYISGRNIDDIKDICYQIKEDGLFETYNQSGKLRDEIWRKNAAQLGLIYTNTHDYTKRAA